MQKAYISATHKDLMECRDAVHTALRRLEIEDVAMEAYVADNQPPLDRCLADVRRCDIYIGLFAWRYGFRPPGGDKSITELEYREAVRLGKACYIFLLSEDAPWPGRLIDRGEDGERIAALRRELGERHVCSFFTGPDDLAAQVTAALANYRWGPREAEPAPPVEPDGVLTEEARGAYLTRLGQQYHGLELDALSPGPVFDYLSVGLTSIFVEPSVREDAPPEIPRAWWQRVQQDGTSASEVPVSAQVARLRALYQAKARERLFDVVTDPEHRLVALLGDPGSGKSAVTRYLALALADDSIPPRLAGLRGHLPVLVELRSYVAHSHDGRCDDFLGYLDHRYRTDRLGLPRDGLEPFLRGGGRALLLFDGLDEIFDPQRRADVASQIAAFAAAFPEVRIIVTSRVIGYSRRTLADAGFDHFTLDDLDDAQMDQFLGGWYRLTMADRAAEAGAQRTRIHDAIAGSAAIRELAGNPLLLTILAVMARDQVLPKERWKLYDHAADVLILHWDVNRQLREHHGDSEPLDGDARKALLQRLALRMQSRDGGLAGNSIDKADLVRVFEDYLVERYQHSRGKASAMANTMIDQFRERNFILGRYGQRLYGFVHRTFLEFFCAQAIVEQFRGGDPDWTIDRLRGLFAEHWADSSWREVLRLIVGALPAQPAGALIEMLATEVNQPWPPEEFPQPPWNLALAAQCVAEVADPRSVKTAAHTVLRQLILLVEHGISIEDRLTVELTEAEILPAVRILGARWPGRENFIYWYRRRGIRTSWTAGSSFATRIAVLLATPEDGIEDLLDRELGSTADRRARHALVAGLAEAAGATGVANRRGGEGRRARCRVLLTDRAAADQHGAVRLEALEALVAHFGAEPRTTQLLIERAANDPYPDLRLAAVKTLGGYPELTSAVRDLLLERAGQEPDETVRRAAVEALGRRCADRPDVEQLLLGRVRADPDAGVVQAAAQALVAGFDAADKVRALLVTRVEAEPTDAVRRGVLRVLAECNPDGDVHELLLRTLRDDPDPGCRTVVLQELTRLDQADPELPALLADRARQDHDGGLRLAALRTLLDRYAADRQLLSQAAGTDSDAGVRTLALRAMAHRFPDGTTADLLVQRAREDGAAGARLAATQLLAEHFASDPRTRQLVIDQSAEERDTVVRLHAVRALVRMGTDPQVHNRLLDRIAQDAEPKIIREAAEALAAWPSYRDQVQRLLAERAKDDDYAGVRLAAVDTLVIKFDAASELALLLDLAAKDPDPAVFLAAAGTLADGLCDSPTMLPLLMARAVEDDPAIRLPALTVLGPHSDADPLVRTLLIERAQQDEEVPVRREALRQLGAAQRLHPEVRALLVDSINDPDWSVRRIAVHALGRHFEGDEHIRALFVEQARTSPDPDTRCLFAQALTWLPGADPEDLPDG